MNPAASPYGECSTSGFAIAECIERRACPHHSNLELTHPVQPSPDDRCVDCLDRATADDAQWWQLGDDIIAPRVCGACAQIRKAGR